MATTRSGQTGLLESIVTLVPETYRSRQFWVQTADHGEILTADLDPMQDGSVCVRTCYSGISRGTETLVFRGEVPPSQHALMRAPFQEGDFPGPIKYGYQNVGEVVEGPPGLKGQTVFCLYPHQDVYTVPASDVCVLPDGVPAGRAVLAANMETAVNIVWDASPGVGDRVVVVGAGVVGLLVAWLCRQIAGTEVVTIDPNPTRRSIAEALGVSWIADLTAGDLMDHEVTGADVVVHASGHPAGLVTALSLAGTEAVVVEASWFGTRPVTVPLGERFHSQRLTIKSSQVGRLPPTRQPRWTHRRRMELALRLLRDPVLDTLISGESEFDDLPQVMRRLSREPGDTLCHRIRYPGATVGVP
jgi:threonine dehydrogenase-like Zn-dependent dehydrogenase